MNIDSLTLLVISIFNATIALFLSYKLKDLYSASLTSVKEKSEGFLFFYRSRIDDFFRGTFNFENSIVSAHYLSVNLFPLFFGLSFFLRSDYNFLVVVISLIWTMQLYQRVYPGESKSS